MLLCFSPNFRFTELLEIWIFSLGPSFYLLLTARFSARKLHYPQLDLQAPKSSVSRFHGLSFCFLVSFSFPLFLHLSPSAPFPSSWRMLRAWHAMLLVGRKEEGEMRERSLVLHRRWRGGTFVLVRSQVWDRFRSRWMVAKVGFYPT